MFSRNEKYGQALHLDYGYNIAKSVTAPRAEGGLWSMITSFFTTPKGQETTAPSNAQMEFDLNRSFIDQAVQRELRNSDAAANENGPALIRHEETA